MIDALIADQVHVADDGVKALCGPVSLSVVCSHRDSERLTAQDGPSIIFTQLEVSDEAMTLVGFADGERRELYQALRRVKGIGRRSALLVLDCGETTDTLRAVAGQDTLYFRGIPGLGATRITAVIEHLAKAYRSVLPTPLPLETAVFVEVRDSLMLQRALSPTDAEEQVLQIVATNTEAKTAADIFALLSQ